MTKERDSGSTPKAQPRTAEDWAEEFAKEGLLGVHEKLLKPRIARALHEYAAQVLEQVFESAGDKSSLAAWLRLAERREREAAKGER